jgi:hypothetical protein
VFEPEGTGIFLLLIVAFAALLVWVAMAKQIVFRVLAACPAFRAGHGLRNRLS